MLNSVINVGIKNKLIFQKLQTIKNSLNAKLFYLLVILIIKTPLCSSHTTHPSLVLVLSRAAGKFACSEEIYFEVSRKASNEPK